MAVAERADTPAAPDGRLPAGFDGPRACGPYELAPDLDLLNLVFRTQAAAGPPRAPSMGWDYSHVYNQHNLENVRIVCHGSRPVASVGIYPTRVQTPRGTIGVGGINAVGTHPEYRRLGLATLTMQDAAARMREIGMHVGLLSTGITNWYRKLGWERAGRQRTFTFDRRNVTSLPEPADLEVTDDWQPHLDELCALRNASGVGAVRTPEVFALLAARKASHVFVARRAGSVVAYATASGASLREYAGAAEDVLALLRHAFGVLEELPARSTERRGPQQGQFELTVQTPAGQRWPAGPPARPGHPLRADVRGHAADPGSPAPVRGAGHRRHGRARPRRRLACEPRRRQSAGHGRGAGQAGLRARAVARLRPRPLPDRLLPVAHGPRLR